MVLIFLLFLVGCGHTPSIPEQTDIVLLHINAESVEAQRLHRAINLPEIVGWQEWNQLYCLQSDSDTLYILPLEAEDEVRCVIASREDEVVSYYLIGFGVAEEDADNHFSGWVWLYDLQRGTRSLTRRFRSDQLLTSDLPSLGDQLIAPANASQQWCLTQSSVMPPPLPARFYQLPWSERLERLAPYLLQLESC